MTSFSAALEILLIVNFIPNMYLARTNDEQKQSVTLKLRRNNQIIGEQSKPLPLIMATEVKIYFCVSCSHDFESIRSSENCYLNALFT